MKLYLFCIIHLIFSTLQAEQKPQKTVCLNMIVKNETAVIKRCLESVKPLIDYWVIVDTGSTDGTQQMIKEFMKDIPGELHERPWVNFGQNRHEALLLAKGKGDYLLFMDADELLEIAPSFTKPLLDKDAYYIITVSGDTEFSRPQLINNHIPWAWTGVLHEAVSSPMERSRGILPDVKNIVYHDGARSQDPQKYIKDAMVLEAAIKNEPNNSRYVFYLAQSYRDAEEPEQAIKYYKKRAEMGGWDQEVYCSYLQIGALLEEIQAPAVEIIEAYKKAIKTRPQRPESYYCLSRYYRMNGDYRAAYDLTSKALWLQSPDDVLFVQKWMYDYGIMLEYSVAAYWIGNYYEAYLASQLLLNNQTIPEDIRELVLKNLEWINSKIKVNNITAAVS